MSDRLILAPQKDRREKDARRGPRVRRHMSYADIQVCYA